MVLSKVSELIVSVDSIEHISLDVVVGIILFGSHVAMLMTRAMPSYKV